MLVVKPGICDTRTAVTACTVMLEHTACDGVHCIGFAMIAMHRRDCIAFVALPGGN